MLLPYWQDQADGRTSADWCLLDFWLAGHRLQYCVLAVDFVFADLDSAARVLTSDIWRVHEGEMGVHLQDEFDYLHIP